MITLLQTTMPTLSDVSGNTRFAVGWGTLSLVNAGLAQSKGRSGLLWWLFSLLLGPVATFLIVILPNVEREREIRSSTGVA